MVPRRQILLMEVILFDCLTKVGWIDHDHALDSPYILDPLRIKL